LIQQRQPLHIQNQSTFFSNLLSSLQPLVVLINICKSLLLSPGDSRLQYNYTTCRTLTLPHYKKAHHRASCSAAPPNFLSTLSYTLTLPQSLPDLQPGPQLVVRTIHSCKGQPNSSILPPTDDQAVLEFYLLPLLSTLPIAHPIVPSGSPSFLPKGISPADRRSPSPSVDCCFESSSDKPYHTSPFVHSILWETCHHDHGG
jgi:hypothetical protein